MNQTLVGLGGLFIVIIQALLIVTYSYSKKAWYQTFTILEMIIISQVFMILFCVFIYIFIINRKSFHYKLKSIFLGDTSSCINLIACSMSIPIIVYISGYLGKNFNLSNLFVIKTALMFIMFQLANYFYVGIPILPKNVITILLFASSLILSLKF